MSWLRAFGQFWLDFIVGDDWKIAAGVALALLGGAALTASVSTASTWVAPVIGAGIVLVFAAVVIADVRGR